MNRIRREIYKAVKYLQWFRDPVLFYVETTGLEPNPTKKSLLRALPDPTFERALISAPRGGGKTLVMAAIALWTLVPCAKVMGMPYFVAVVSGSREQAIQLYSSIEIFLKHPFIASEVRESLKTMTTFKDGGLFRAFPNSPKAIRGPHPDVLLIDEAVETGAETILMAEEGVLWNKPYSRIIHSSTPHDYESYFVKMFLDEERFKEYRRFQWSWRECPWKSEKQFKVAYATKPKKVIQTEWEGLPYGEEGEVFSREDIWQAGVRTKPERVENATVNMGCDWGFFRATAVVVVQWLGEVVEVLDVKTFKEEDPVKVSNAIKEMFFNYQAFKLFADSSHIHENLRLQNLGVNVEPVVFKNERTFLEANLQMLLKSKKIRIWEGFDELRRQLANYNPQTTRARDIVDALLLACKRTYSMSERTWTTGIEETPVETEEEVPGWVSKE